MRSWGREGWLVITTAGSALIVTVFGMTMFVLRDSPYSFWLIVVGLSTLIFSAAYPRLIEAEVTPRGARVKLGPIQEESLVIAEEDTVGETQIDEADELIVGARSALAGEALGAILRPIVHDEGTTNFRLYLYDADTDRLAPVIISATLPEHGSRETWIVGKGATGTAYQDGRFVFVTGDAIRDSTYGVTPEQAETFEDLTAVAAIPVLNASEAPLGVLTATSNAPDGGELSDEESAYYEVQARALLAARALVDLLGWFSDQYP